MLYAYIYIMFKGGRNMKNKIKSLLGVTFAITALGASAISINAAKDFKPALADPTNPEVFYIGEHNLLENPVCNEYDGTAELTVVSGEYVLTLTNFNNNGAVINPNPSSPEIFFSALTYHNPTKNLKIKLSGACTLTNDGEHSAMADYNHGIYIATKFDTNFNVTIEGVDGTNPVLNVSSPAFGESSAINFTSVSGTAESTLTISNCVVNATAEQANYSSYGIECLAGGTANLVISNAEVNATSGGVDSENESGEESVGIATGTYTQNGGKVTATSGPTFGSNNSYGMKISRGNATVTNGSLLASGGNTVSGWSAGTYLSSGYLSLGEKADVTAIGGNPTDTQASWGVKRNSSSDIAASIGENASYFYAYTRKSNAPSSYAVAPKFDAGFTGYSSDTNIFTNPNPTEIAAGTGKYDYKDQLLFVKEIVYEATSTSTIYDGNPHDALTLTRAKPEVSTAQFRVKGETEWSDTIPQFTDANLEGYEVEFKLESNFCPNVLGNVVFIITKANSTITTAPTKVADFTAGGQAQALVNAGVADGGTIMYSVNGGEYSASVPTAKDVGTYVLTYKVVGDNNHNDIEPTSLGTVTISEAPTPTPTPTPVDPSNNGGLPAWGIVLIVLGGLLGLCCLCLLALFIFNPRYIIDYINKKVIRVIYVKEHYNMVLLRDARLRKVRRNKLDVYKSREEAEKALNK